MKLNFVWAWAFAATTVAVVAACGSTGGGSIYSGGDSGPDGTTMDGPHLVFETGNGEGGHGGPHCTPLTCKKLGFTCGPAGDGCGGKIDCGSCKAPETCGGGGKFSQCGGKSACVPKTCADLGVGCGPAGDGCGGKLDCGSCTAPASCGGGGVHSQCGSFAPPEGGVFEGGLCKPLTCADQGIKCGPAGDGCGDKIKGGCGTCKSGESCGGGGTPGVCGTGTTTCVPNTCAGLGFNCGVAGDGCGGMLDCGAETGCPGSQTCGGGGKPGVCGGFVPPEGGVDGGVCVPLTCAGQGFNCGPAGDGCGDILNCGTCSKPGDTCGGGGAAGVCGQNPPCVPATCASLGITCGPAADGCGGLLNCDGDGGGCVAPNICGGGGIPGQCGDIPTCTGLCLDVPACESGTTTLTGTVVAGTQGIWLGGGSSTPDPVPNVLVYVPNGPITAFTDGPECGCAAVSGAPFISTNTDYLGNFTLTGVPVPPGGVVPLVIQLGKWRRVFGLGNPLNPGFNVTACSPNSTGPIHMPRNHNEGDIPLTAVSTGLVDQLECVLLKMGVDQAEFTDPAAVGGTGRIQLFQGNGAIASPYTPGETTLNPDATSAPNLNLYDQVLFPCWGEDPRTAGSPNIKTANQQNNVVNYTTAGGRIFNTHYSYSWLYNVAPFSTTANWITDNAWTAGTGNIAVPSTYPDVTTFDQWMNALTTNGSVSDQFPINTERNDFNTPASNTELWVSITGATGGSGATSFPVTYTFATPYSAPPSPPATCGKVIYSDFHVVGTGAYGGWSCDIYYTGTCQTFPGECGPGGEMTPQEKSLEYLIWDLASCPPGPPPPTCTPQTCGTLGYTCGGPYPDGCGGTIASCGTCTGCETCGGGGKAGSCGGTCCVPETCGSLGFMCGSSIPDGCGGTIPSCGTCPPGMTCGGGGTPGVCGSIDGGSSCTPQTCALLGYTCGTVPDGCGGTLNCGTCTGCETCGGGGVAGACGGTCCKKITCADQGFSCGPAGDGCGGSLNCGTCTPPLTCGGGGKTGVCGEPEGSACVPLTCAGQGIDCGPAGDGCGGSLSCGTCPKGETCGGGGVSGKCGKPACTPKTCKELGFNCGPAGDGCGGTLNCGSCTGGLTCGGGGAPGVCGMMGTK